MYRKNLHRKFATRDKIGAVHQTSGQLLRYYREREGYELQVDLVRLLCNGGFPVSPSAVQKYESGERRMPPGFVYHVARLLELSMDETKCLCDAVLADYHADFHAEFDAVGKGYEKMSRPKL